MKVTFIRHTSVDVEPGICYGATDVPLRPSFPEEAGEVKKRLDSMSFDRVYTSPLSRCVLLAEFCGFHNAIKDDRLREMNFGEWEMQYYEDIADPRLQEWYGNYMEVRATGGESFRDQGKRLSEFLRDTKGENVDNIAVFTHGGIILNALLLAGAENEEDLFSVQPSYGGIITLEF